jgi:hypothetical protein
MQILKIVRSYCKNNDCGKDHCYSCFPRTE